MFKSNPTCTDTLFNSDPQPSHNHWGSEERTNAQQVQVRLLHVSLQYSTASSNRHLTDDSLFQGWRNCRACYGLQLIHMLLCTWRCWGGEENIYNWIIPFRVVSCRHGGVQVHLGVVPQEAERCHALPAPHQVLAVSPAHQGKILVLSKDGPIKLSQWLFVLQFWPLPLHQQIECEWNKIHTSLSSIQNIKWSWSL